MLWGYAITGIVGLAGIGGTLWSGRLAAKSAVQTLTLSISAEDRRAKVAEKRRIYAAYLASLVSLVVETNNLEQYGPQMSKEDRHAKELDVESAISHVADAVSLSA